ncbi:MULTISPECIES: trimeric intracellular cation channel family protein [unclassified Lactococcus]|uniref:trimeric intracellular cation channel family protein n=1 Tax=unclassified Lactococcus TaxID=2643510 RepID=UPI002108449A|nr:MULTISPECIES: trimeric intracellular cation channel family protein [unclassified Lactococcus]
MISTIYEFLEIIGTVAFAVSGTVVGMNHRLDVFGIVSMAVVTAVGGGIIRDLFIGVIPPSTLQSPFYITVSIIASVLTMIIAVATKKRRASLSRLKITQFYNFVLILSDAIGLGIFTIVGIDSGIAKGYEHNLFLIVFLGVVTGVGGGMIRDLFANQVPMIFRENIYAVSCIIGGVIYALLLPYLNHYLTMLICIICIVTIRLVSEKQKLNLPHIEY